MADPTRRDLVDRDADVNIRSRGLLGSQTRQECRAGTRMIARPVLATGGVDLVQTGEDLDLGLQPFQWLEGGGQVEVFPFRLRPPALLVDPVGNVHEGHPDRGAGCGGRRQTGCLGGRDRTSRKQRIQRREGQRHTQPSEEMTTAQACISLSQGRFIVRKE